MNMNEDKFKVGLITFRKVAGVLSLLGTKHLWVTIILKEMRNIYREKR